MRRALFPISYSVLRDFFRLRFKERRVQPLCHLLIRQQWVRLLDAAEGLRTFLEENKSKLKLKSKA